MLKLLVLVVLLSMITPSETVETRGVGRLFGKLGRLFRKLFRGGIRTAAQFARKFSPAFRRIGAISIGRDIAIGLIVSKIIDISFLKDKIGEQKIQSRVNDADANKDGKISDDEWDPLWRNIGQWYGMQYGDTISVMHSWVRFHKAILGKDGQKELEKALVEKRSVDEFPAVDNE